MIVTIDCWVPSRYLKDFAKKCNEMGLLADVKKVKVRGEVYVQVALLAESSHISKAFQIGHYLGYLRKQFKLRMK